MGIHFADSIKYKVLLTHTEDMLMFDRRLSGIMNSLQLKLLNLPSWRWMYWITSLFGILVLPCILYFIEEPRARKDPD